MFTTLVPTEPLHKDHNKQAKPKELAIKKKITLTNFKNLSTRKQKIKMVDFET